MPAYITRSAVCLPNAPVENDEVEAVLGQVGERPSRARRIVLRSNGIRQRHYAIDPATGRPTHTNASMTAAGGARAAGDGFALEDIACLACGTSIPDQLMPNHAVMVHGELGAAVCEVVATAGVCLSGTTALKYAWLAVAAGSARERGGHRLRARLASRWRAELRRRAARSVRGALEAHPELAFEKDFLRWMLSDGAGACCSSPRRARGLNLRIDWIDIFSSAHELPTCMYVGADEEARRQPARLAASYPAGEREAQVDLRAQAGRAAAQRGHRRVHAGASRCSAWSRGASCAPPTSTGSCRTCLREYFRKPLAEGLARAGLPIPQERWFTNLASVGNTGSAALYIMLDELLRSGRLRTGQRCCASCPRAAASPAASSTSRRAAHA